MSMLEVNFNPFPILSTERLLLREIVEADAEAVFKMRSDKNVMQFVGRPLATSIDDAIVLIKKITEGHRNNEGINWAITVKDKPTLIGIICFWRIEKEHYRGELGYMLQPAFQGKGIMQEAVEKVLDYGFSILKLHSVEAHINPANAASIKVLEKHHFIQEAYFKENYYYNGQFSDSAIYSLLTPIQ
jgi:[ribosomal protein S5]-alanine N-acetyltransferase